MPRIYREMNLGNTIDANDKRSNAGKRGVGMVADQ
jgi:hypothetical protein